MGGKFAGVEKMIQETFFPLIFFGKAKYLSPIVGNLSMMRVKKVRLGLLNPGTSEK